MGILHDFGRRMKELRLKAGMSQEVLATRAALDRSYVGSIERGEKNLSLINIEKIANALDVDLSYMFEDERFAPRSTYFKRELKKPLESRFIYVVNVQNQVISWRVAGPLRKQDVLEISQKIKSTTLLMTKGEIKLLIDNSTMMIDGQPYVFTPEVNAVWEELQGWLFPYLKKVVVLCNSKLMQNQLDRLARRSGIAKMSKHIFGDDPQQNKSEALAFLGTSDPELLTVMGEDLTEERTGENKVTTVRESSDTEKI